MKTKRYIFIIGLAFFLFLLFKNSIQLKAASYFYKDLSISEYNQLKDIVSRKIHLTEFNYEMLSGYDSNCRYILVEGEDCYLIYDRELSDYTEFSLDTNSVYFNLNSSNKKCYLGPTYYFSIGNQCVTDL